MPMRRASAVRHRDQKRILGAGGVIVANDPNGALFMQLFKHVL